PLPSRTVGLADRHQRRARVFPRQRTAMNVRRFAPPSPPEATAWRCGGGPCPPAGTGWRVRMDTATARKIVRCLFGLMLASTAANRRSEVIDREHNTRPFRVRHHDPATNT